jgi:hypothetical protein
MSIDKEISKYESDLMGVQEVRWDRGGTEPACEYTFFHEKSLIIYRFFMCVRESYKQLRGWSLLAIGYT